MRSTEYFLGVDRGNPGGEAGGEWLLSSGCGHPGHQATLTLLE